MRKFMHNNIIPQFLRQKKEPVIEIQIALTATASPADLLVANRNSSVGDIHLHRIIFCLCFKFQLHLLYLALGQFLRLRNPVSRLLLLSLLIFGQLFIIQSVCFATKRSASRSGSRSGTRTVTFPSRTSSPSVLRAEWMIV